MRKLRNKIYVKGRAFDSKSKSYDQLNLHYIDECLMLESVEDNEATKLNVAILYVFIDTRYES